MILPPPPPKKNIYVEGTEGILMPNPKKSKSPKSNPKSGSPSKVKSAKKNNKNNKNSSKNGNDNDDDDDDDGMSPLNSTIMLLQNALTADVSRPGGVATLKELVELGSANYEGHNAAATTTTTTTTTTSNANSRKLKKLLNEAIRSLKAVGDGEINFANESSSSSSSSRAGFTSGSSPPKKKGSPSRGQGRMHKLSIPSSAAPPGGGGGGTSLTLSAAGGYANAGRGGRYQKLKLTDEAKVSWPPPPLS